MNQEILTIKINDKEIKVQQTLSKRQKEILEAGGLINWVKENLS